MDNQVFESIFPFKVEDLVSLIIEKKQFSFDEALDYLYSSKLYGALQFEETKLWHLSTEKLYDMLVNDDFTDTVDYPDFI
jgi:hypothetical protein